MYLNECFLPNPCTEMFHPTSNSPHSAILPIKDYWEITPVSRSSQRGLLSHHVQVHEITPRNSLQGSLPCVCVMGTTWSFVLNIWQLPPDSLGERVAIIMVLATMWRSVGRGNWNIGSTSECTLRVSVGLSSLHLIYQSRIAYRPL